MNLNSDYESPFGNKISKWSLLSAKIINHFVKRIFGNTIQSLDLVAIPKGEAYKTFDVLTLVERSDISAMQNNETGKLYDYEEISEKKSIIIGTIRMGFGHWRIAIAIASAAHSLGIHTYLLDLRSFKNNIGKTVKFLDNYYSSLSRFSQRSKWFNEHVWEKVTSKINAGLDSCIIQRNISKLFSPVFANVPKNIPIIAAHPWVGHAAVLAGNKKVISMIPDNLPLAFWLVEGSIHCVQSPSSFIGYRTFSGMEKGYPIQNALPKEKIFLAGHYIDYEIEANLKDDCKRRLERIKNHRAKRFLLTIGGAGAQGKIFFEIVKYCKKDTENGRATLLINMGDNKDSWFSLKKEFDKNSIDYKLHSNWEFSKIFIDGLKDSDISGIHVFFHQDFFAAVYTTNLLIRECDVMITKPSELSFYPIPKIFIQRVGNHEAWGAIRGSEIGSGTREISKIDELKLVLRTMIEDDDILITNINCILSNDKAKIYNGTYKIVKYFDR
jgi:hypothetical protein